MTRLGKYELLEEIGRGGFGTVYRARDIVLKVERAVKALHPALAADPSFIERFRREAQIAARFEHPHIVHSFDPFLLHAITTETTFVWQDLLVVGIRGYRLKQMFLEGAFLISERCIVRLQMQAWTA